MRTVELVVPIAGEHEGGNSLDPATEQPEDVEGGLIRPVQVLEDENRGDPSLELTHEGRRDLMWSGAALDALLELATGDRGNVKKWREGTRREKRIARPPENSGRSTVLVAEPPDERRLPDPCLAPDEHEAPAQTVENGGEKLAQSGEVVRSFEELQPT
jgi:hypothetical protein